MSAVYCVESASELGAGLKTLGVMREEIIRCPENMNDYNTEVELISESKKQPYCEGPFFQI